MLAGIEFIPEIIDWIRLLNTLDYLVIVVTNHVESLAE